MFEKLDEAQRLEKEHHFQIYKRFPVTITEGKGVKVWDSEGNEYVDALSGIAVNSLGHCHPNVVKAIREQAGKLIHISNLFYTKPQSDLANLLTRVSGMDRVFFGNSGAEAVEGAIKLARKYAYKKEKRGPILFMSNCFHGRTIATLTMGKKKYQEGFAPLPDGFKEIPFNDIKALKNELNKGAIAVIIEPVQGEGGIHPANKDFLREARDQCDKNGALLILDEIQCGIARTGKMFAYQHYDIKPDIIATAKALGGGFPISAVLASEDVAKVFEYGNHGTTFGGNPLACAAAFASLNTIINENLDKQAEEKGEYFKARLEKYTAGISEVKEIRAIGLMIGVELSFNCSSVVNKMLAKGVIANCTAETVVRLVPPLIIEKEDIDFIIKKMIESIEEAIKEKEMK